MAFGLAEQKLLNWESALTAFAMSVVTDTQDLLSFIHSAECYIALGKNAEAEGCIQSALGLLESKSDDEKRQLTDYISSLQKSLS